MWGRDRWASWWSVWIAAQRNGGRVGELAVCFAAHGPQSPGEPLLRHGVQAVAVDHGGLVYTGVRVYRDFDGQATSLGGDLGHGHVGTDIEHLVAGDDQDRAWFAANFGEPDLAASHGWPQASASSQSASSCSGSAW